MTSKRNDHEIDPRLHAYLDGELSPSDAAAFEGDLRSGMALGNHVETLQHLGAWSQATRPRAPSSLSRVVEQALERERARSPRVSSSAPPWWKSIQVRPLA